MRKEKLMSERNQTIHIMLSTGERLKDFYRFTAQNPHINLHDACQIVIERPKASICFYLDEWNALGRRVTKGRKGIRFYDTDGNSQYVYDLHDTHGDKRYRRLIFPMRRLLYGLDELNGTRIAESNRRDYNKILSGVAIYLEENGYFTEDERRNSLIAEGVAYSLYCNTGFPKNGGIVLRGMSYDLSENARLFKEIHILTETMKEDIDAAYERYIRTPEIINDIDEDTISDEPVLPAERLEDSETATERERAAASEYSDAPKEKEPTAKPEVTEQPQGNTMYRQYMAAQREKPEAVVVYRLGDFYEVMGERAAEVAGRLNLTLTSRDVGLPDRIPMCGFPYHVTETYIEKILEFRGVYILEPNTEAKYILSYAEMAALSDKNKEEDFQSDETDSGRIDETEKLAELEEAFAAEFGRTQDVTDSGQITEPDDERLADEEHKEPHDGKEKGKGKEKSIRERKRIKQPQPTLWDYFLPQEKSREEELIESQLLRGSGFQDGKYRIYDTYFTDPSIKEYADFLKHEYGTGGYGNGNEQQAYDAKGIRMEWRDSEHPENDLCIDLKWQEVAVRIADLIDEGRYLSDEEKREYELRYKPEQRKERVNVSESDINRFRELTPEGRKFYAGYAERSGERPYYSPWGTVQTCTKIEAGIYSVSTAGHGGIMIKAELAPYILSPEALAEGIVENGYYAFEEDAAESIPLRELYDKGILDKTTAYFAEKLIQPSGSDTKGGYIPFADLSDADKEVYLKEWNKTINESIAYWYPVYWHAYEQAENPERKDNDENTDLNAVLDQSELGGAKARYKSNVDAIRLMKRLYAEGRSAHTEERGILAKYVGWGGLAQAFDETNKQWAKEYAELKTLLSLVEYDCAKGSVLNAHYTSKEVIDGIYSALERFGVKGNNRILEPALGTGNFFGYMPQSISAGAELHGVELDEITGRIAAKLYPQAKVQIKGFEETSFPSDYFDLVVSNVPFGGYGVYDSEYSRQKFMIHDYFIAKSIDRVKPHGIVAVVTSKGTLDKLNPTARKYMAERAELLGAIRLPNTTFRHTANTEVVTDILFFQKRSERLADTSSVEWLGTDKTPEGFEVNNYFIHHPEMVLGTFARETGLYGAESVTVKPDDRELCTALREAVSLLPENIYENPARVLAAEEIETAYVWNIRPMCYAVINEKVYMRIGDKLVEQDIPVFPKDAYERIKGMTEIRNELRSVLEMQTNNCTDAQLQTAQRTLNVKYDRFVKKYGFLNSQTNTRLFHDDGDAALLLACETLSEDKTKATKADVFTKRTIRPYTAVTHTSDTQEALQICRNERGRVEIDYIEELTGKDFDTVLTELGGAVYRDPVKVDETDKYSGYVTAEDYLSENVVEKLRIARAYAEQDKNYVRNAVALEKIQPIPLTADEISVRIGVSWVKEEYYKQFLMELLQISNYFSDGLIVRYNKFDGSWKVERSDYVRSNAGVNATQKYGTARANAFRLFEDSLNQRVTSVYDMVEVDGKEKRILNREETIAAREKQNKIKEAFADWIYSDPDRRKELEETYNRLFNQVRLPSYDGSYLKFPGMNPAIELRPHQKDAVARIAGTGNSTLLHHVVGSGKSFTMAAAAMKLRQYGLAKKPMIVVPNHLVQQMANEFRTLYPTAKILIASKEDFEKKNRQKFVSKVALGDWDSVIIAQSSFAKIPVSLERQERMISKEIENIENAILEMRKDKNKHSAVKNLERVKKGREAMLKRLTDSSKKDNVLIFESLGVDYLFVDEADAYKNLFLYTKMNNVSGISNVASARASDMQMKIEYINELHGGDKGVVFATGTPISNTMAEMYVMQKYLQRNTLEQLGINYFDAWAANFGETVTALEMSPSGQGYRARTRFAKFTNLPELMTMYRSFADVQTADMVKLNVPTAERITETLEPSAVTVRIAEEIAWRAENIYKGGVNPHEDNMLKVTSDGKKLALDIRCFDSFLKDNGQGKLDACAANVVKVYEETAIDRGTQLIFCDMSTPKKSYESYEYGKDFDVYNDLKYKLIEREIPAGEIAFIHEAKTDKEKQVLFDKMNAGKIRILIGSTEKCGAGTNVQKRLAALHHLDAPYRPRDLQQRDGRGIRQGNMNESVKIFTYVTKRTLDSYCYQILENKQRFISQIENGSLTVREAEDIDETMLTYAEIKAITAANPKIKRKMELETELTRLRILEGQYKKSMYALQEKVFRELPDQIRHQEQMLQYAQEDEENMRAKYKNGAFSINVLGKTYTDKMAGAAALMEALRGNKYETPVAEYGGFRISLNPLASLDGSHSVSLTYRGSYNMEIGESESGLIVRLDNFMKDFPERRERYASHLEQLKRDLSVAEEELKKPFEHKAEIIALSQELSELNAELDLNKSEEIVIETDEQNETEEEINFMALPEQDKKNNSEKRSHRHMTERLYKEYSAHKVQSPDAVIFIKNGEYYETVGPDAETLGAKYGLTTYQKELTGAKRTVARLGYDDLDRIMSDLLTAGHRAEIVEQLTLTDEETDFLETDEEAAAIAGNENVTFSQTFKQVVLPDYFVDRSVGSMTHYPLSRRKAQQLYNLYQEVGYMDENQEYVPIRTQKEMNEQEGHFCIEKETWRKFTETETGKAYLYARLLAANTTNETIQKKLDYVGMYADQISEILYAEREDLQNFFANRPLPEEQAVRPYLYGLCREYASRLDGDGNLVPYGWWYEDVINTVVNYLPEPYKDKMREVNEWELRALQLDSVYYAITEQNGNWNLFEIDEYQTCVTRTEFRDRTALDRELQAITTDSPLWCEEVSYESLQEIAAELKLRRKEYLAEDVQIFKDPSKTIRPDYSITDNEMREYGYTKTGMLPLRRHAAEILAQRFMLPVYTLYRDNTERQTQNRSDIYLFGGICGVKREDWEKFLDTEIACAYFAASFFAASAAIDVLITDMVNLDARATIGIANSLLDERDEIRRYLSQAEMPDTEAIKPYLRQVMREYAYRINEAVTSEYNGWDDWTIEQAMIKHLGPKDLQEYAQEKAGTALFAPGELPADSYYGPEYDRIQESVRKEYAAFVQAKDNELPYKRSFYQAIAAYFANDGMCTLNRSVIAELLSEDGKILERLYTYYWDGSYLNLDDMSMIGGFIAQYNENRLAADEAGTDRDYVAAVRERVANIYEKYKNTYPDYTDNKGANLFYRKISDYLLHTETLPYAYYIALEQAGDEMLARMYSFYEQDGDLSLDSSRRQQEIIEKYTETYYTGILEQAGQVKFFGLGADNTAYYYLPDGLSLSALQYIKIKADRYVIAAPKSTLSEKETGKYGITFLKTKRDISESAVYGTATAARYEMRRTAERILRDKRNFTAVVENAQTALKDLQNDPGTERTGYKERFFHAFAECIEASDYLLTAGDYAELVKDGINITDRIYAYYMDKPYAVNFEEYEEFTELIKHYIDERRTEQEEIMNTPIYHGTWEDAVKRGETKEYNRSLQANVQCRYAIEEAMRANFDGQRLQTGFTNELVGQYGVERVRYVLANTVQQLDHDGRFSPQTKKWAQGVTIAETHDQRPQFIVTTHPAVLDGFIANIRTWENTSGQSEQTDLTEQSEAGGENMQKEKYRIQTLRGLPVISIEQDKYGHDIAIVKRTKDYVVAIGYDVNTGMWSQGRYDFPTQESAQEFINANYKPKSADGLKWLTAKVSRDALIQRYDRHSFFRMPNGAYEQYTYNVFNNLIKDSRQLVNLESDGYELCYELVFPADSEVLLKDRMGNEITLSAGEFVFTINGTANKDYERTAEENETQWYGISIPAEALRGTYEKSSLFTIPTSGELAGYSYYIPNTFVQEDKSAESGNILITLPADFTIALKNHRTEDEILITPEELYTACNETTAADYARRSDAKTESKPEKIRTVIPNNAKIADYAHQTLFKMPETSEYAGYCFYLFNDQLSYGDDGFHAKLSENFEVRLRDNRNDKSVELSAKQFQAIMEGKTDKDFKSGLYKPSEEQKRQYQERETMLRKNLPPEMLARPNWVAVHVYRDKKKDKLVKLPKDAKTGESASPYDPSTWSDFDTACAYAREHGCVSLAYALDGQDKICCVDADHCYDGQEFSDTASDLLGKSLGTYIERSVSGSGLHVFGKTDGLGLRVFSDAGDLEFYERGKFITLTGEMLSEDNRLMDFDASPVKELLTSRFSPHMTYSGISKGIEGLSSMSDREVIEKACAAMHGETFKALYDGQDIQNNHSNSDMALMTRLAFWCNGDKDQMLRIFATSGLYRPDKSPDYYEHTALKAVRENPNRYEPRSVQSGARQSVPKGTDKGGK